MPPIIKTRYDASKEKLKRIIFEKHIPKLMELMDYFGLEAIQFPNSNLIIHVEYGVRFCFTEKLEIDGNGNIQHGNGYYSVTKYHDFNTNTVDNVNLIEYVKIFKKQIDELNESKNIILNYIDEGEKYIIFVPRKVLIEKTINNIPYVNKRIICYNRENPGGIQIEHLPHLAEIFDRI